MIAATLGAMSMSMAWAADAIEKNWTPPNQKMYAQQLSEKVMAQHPELLSFTLHGVPPGAAPKTYTMFAGSFPDRIGKKDSALDAVAIETGITIVDPKWSTPDAAKKVVLYLPTRDKNGENAGLLVLAYKNDKKDANSGIGKSDKDFYLAAIALRDSLQPQIPSYAALFESAR